MKVAILHEGNQKSSDKKLLKLLIEKLNSDFKNKKFLKEINFIGMGTKNNFFKVDNENYKLLKNEIEREDVGKVLFVVDADYESNDNTYGGYQNTQKELNKTIAQLGLENISDTYITCNPITQDGNLESLILSSIKEEQKECIETFLACSEFKSKESHKAILNKIYKTAYPNKPFNFDHPHFNDLKTKLTHLLT
jgi:hypothetical protein